MKKYVFIIFANITLLLMMLMLANFYIDKNIYKESFDKKLGFNHFFYNGVLQPKIDLEKFPHEPNLVEKLPLTQESLQQFCGEKRTEFEKNNTEKPIIVLGCSYAYGQGLQKQETFSYILSKLTNRTVYNYSSCGTHIFQNIDDLMLDNKNIKKLENSEYVIYIYMYDHMNRYLQIRTLYSYYEDFWGVSKNKFHNFLLNKVPLYKFICTSYQLKKILKGYPNTINIQLFLKKLLLISYNKIKLFSPNTQMIIILYEEKIPLRRPPYEIAFAYSLINSNIWKELELETKGAIKIVRTKDIMGFYLDKDYKLEKDIAEWHPNARFWKEFTPKFISQYVK